MSSEDDRSGGEGHSGGESTDDVFVYDGVGVGDGLDDLDDTPRIRRNTGSGNKLNFVLSPRSAPTGKARWQRPTPVGFPMRRPGAGRANRLCAPEMVGATEAAVIPRTTPWGALTSPRQHHPLRKTAGRIPAVVGKANQRLRPPRHPTPHPRQIAGRKLPSRYVPGG